MQPGLFLETVLHVDCCLLQINKLHLCKPLIRAIDSSNLKDDYSTAQRVTYRYYVGRKAMFDSDFQQGAPAALALVAKGECRW